MPQRVKFSNKNQWSAIFKTKILLSFYVKQIYCLYIAYSVFIESKRTLLLLWDELRESITNLKKNQSFWSAVFLLIQPWNVISERSFQANMHLKVIPAQLLCMICLFVWTSTLTYNLDWDFVWNKSENIYYFFI